MADSTYDHYGILYVRPEDRRDGAIYRCRERWTVTCAKCRGSGVFQNERCKPCRGRGCDDFEDVLDVRVPAGCRVGQKLRIRGKGHFAYGERGDLYYEIRDYGSERIAPELSWAPSPNRPSEPPSQKLPRPRPVSGQGRVLGRG